MRLSIYTNPVELLKLLADPTRLRCLMLLLAEGELCVCELTHALEESQPKISRHLASLRVAGLILSRRSAQWVHYHINPEVPDWVHDLLQAGMAGMRQNETYLNDRKRLQDMQDRPAGNICN